MSDKSSNPLIKIDGTQVQVISPTEQIFPDLFYFKGAIPHGLSPDDIAVHVTLDHSEEPITCEATLDCDKLVVTLTHKIVLTGPTKRRVARSSGKGAWCLPSEIPGNGYPGSGQDTKEEGYPTIPIPVPEPKPDDEEGGPDSKNSTYAIIGIRQGWGPAPEQVPLRYEVDEWYGNPANKDQINLFFLAMSRFQSLPPDAKLSYWQVCGIHSQPLVPWDEKTQSKTAGRGLGYCTHNSNLFPLWHRSYMLLFEQRLFEIMRDDVIPEFPQNQQAALLTAANQWRFPYWDWAAKKARAGSNTPVYDVPTIVTLPNIEVLTPTGLRTISNPVYAFKTAIAMGDPSLGANGLLQSTPPVCTLNYSGKQMSTASRSSQKTLAYQAWVNGVQNNQELANNLRGLQLSQGGRFTDTLGESVYRLFSEKYFSSFSAFALAFASTAHRQSQTPTDFSSLESIHNNIHNSVGGTNGGHMSSPAVAAFDPNFWFHHCNVDRQFAIWQALNSDSWFEDPREQLADPEGNWSTPPGAIPSPENTPLAPFHIDAVGTYWTSNDAREWLKYGYSYPELQQWLPKYRTGGRFNQELYKADIAKQVNALYSDTRQILLTRGLQSSRGSRGSAGHILSSVEGVDRFALAGLSFTIHIYIGQDTCVGTLYNFSTPAHTTGVNDGCENCRRQESGHALCTGQVPITSSLLKYVADDGVPLSSMEPEQVEAYLKKNLTWTVTKAYGEDVPISSISSLEVSLAVGTGCHYGGHSRLSKYHSYRVLPGCTEGRPGGYRRPNPPPPRHAEAAFA
ncbi:Di-copper centre-containing protein [Sistotremastrum suecicum HHB10207 ss-3]|uniref:tyrosinase n=1 Tax=Sistotremastrum suecicum HHB10207 ss-3 TaxID=1314776 RepID=A0A166AA12_9AGAM|nr:Di-copper centre-containing protein [Sistotremastrum suecicum HHB10207 ss-3]